MKRQTAKGKVPALPPKNGACFTFAERKGEEELETYRRDNNLVTIDGKPTGYPIV